MCIQFPKDFIWGVATSAFQIEGAAFKDGKSASIWDVFAHAGKCYENQVADVSCDHYNLYKEDVAQMKALGVNSYRFSFSWPRILPDGTGRINQKGLDFYKRLVDELLINDIIPNATLYHWDLPQILHEKGGWTNRDVKDWFAEYAGVMFREFGDLIPYWSTLNEPVAIYAGYGLGWFAPGIQNEKSGKSAIHHAMLAHGEAVKAFRAENIKNAKVGVVIDFWKNYPARDCEEDRALAIKGDENSFRLYWNGMFKGIYSDYILTQMKKEGTLPDIRPGDMELMCQPLDFYGLNVYNRTIVSADREYLNKQTEEAKKRGGNFMDNGTEFYPQSVYEGIKLFRKEYDPILPIIITENGTPDYGEEIVDGRVHDEQRIMYVEGFLNQIHRAISEGDNIHGYYLWSLMDNFEWSAGYSMRFGLLHMDHQTRKRIWKDSAYWYQNVIRNNGI